MNDDNRPRGAAGSSEIAFGDILKLLLSRFHWVLLAGVVAAALVYTAITVLVTPTYESRVSFYVYNSANNDAHDTINNSDLQAAESLAATYSKILESNSVLDSVLADIRGETALSRKELNRMVQVSVISDTQLLEVVVTSADPKLACRIADAFATVAPTEIVRITKAGGVEIVDRPEVAPEKTAPRTVFDSAAQSAKAHTAANSFCFIMQNLRANVGDPSLHGGCRNMRFGLIRCAARRRGLFSQPCPTG